MTSLAKKIRLILTIKCDHARLLDSKSRDQTLPRHERLAAWFHRRVCRSCRQFHAQIAFLTQVMKSRAKRDSRNERLQLSEECKHRLKNLRV